MITFNHRDFDFFLDLEIGFAVNRSELSRDLYMKMSNELDGSTILSEGAVFRELREHK